MAIADSMAALAGTLLATLRTRLELISVELEEELARYSSYLLWSLVALFCAGIAVLLAILLIVALYWDSHRMLVLLSLIALFGGAAIVLAWWLRLAIRNKPRLLASTFSELKKDSASLRAEPEERL